MQDNIPPLFNDPALFCCRCIFCANFFKVATINIIIMAMGWKWVLWVYSIMPFFCEAPGTSSDWICIFGWTHPFIQFWKIFFLEELSVWCDGVPLQYNTFSIWQSGLEFSVSTLKDICVSMFPVPSHSGSPCWCLQSSLFSRIPLLQSNYNYF